MNTNMIFQSNRDSTARIKKLVEGLSDSQLKTILPNGWTISVTLAHLAFWDHRVIHVIEMAKKEGKVIRTELDVQLNDIIEPFFRAIPSEEVAKLVILNAEMLDQLLEGCSIETLAQLEAESPRWVDRSLHRNSHLDEIEIFLRSK